MNTKTKSAEEKRLAAIRAHHERNCSVIIAARFHQVIVRFDGKEKIFPKTTKFETFLQFLIEHPTATVWVLNVDTMKLEPLMGFVPWTEDCTEANEPEADAVFLPNSKLADAEPKECEPAETSETKEAEKKLAKCMQRLGWEGPHKMRIGAKPQRGYCRLAAAEHAGAPQGDVKTPPWKR